MKQSFFQKYQASGDMPLARKTMQVYREDISLYISAINMGMTDLGYLEQTKRVDVLVGEYKQRLFRHQYDLDMFKAKLYETLIDVPAINVNFGLIAQINLINQMLMDQELYEILAEQKKLMPNISNLLETATGERGLPKELAGVKEFVFNRMKEMGTI